MVRGVDGDVDYCGGLVVASGVDVEECEEGAWGVFGFVPGCMDRLI